MNAITSCASEAAPLVAALVAIVTHEGPERCVAQALERLRERHREGSGSADED